MQKPMFVTGVIPVSGSKWSEGIIPLVRTRTITITVRLTCGSSIDQDITVGVYYSPDGRNWDTQAYTSFDITYSAGNTVQRTVNIDPPEHGFMRVKITNNSSADTLTDVSMWYSIQSWEQPGWRQRGDIRIDRGEEKGG